MTSLLSFAAKNAYILSYVTSISLMDSLGEGGKLGKKSGEVKSKLNVVRRLNLKTKARAIWRES